MTAEALVNLVEDFPAHTAPAGFQDNPEEAFCHGAFVDFCFDAPVHQFIKPGHTQKNPYLIVAEGFQQVGRLHGGSHGDGSADIEGGHHRSHQGEDMMQGQENHDLSFGGEDSAVDDRRHVLEEIGEGEHHSLGASRSSGGVDDHRRGLIIFGSQPFAFVYGVVRCDLLKDDDPGFVFCDQVDIGQALSHCSTDEKPFGLAVIEDIGHIFGRGHEVDGHGDSFDLEGSVKSIDPFRPVFAEDGGFCAGFAIKQPGVLLYILQ